MPKPFKITCCGPLHGDPQRGYYLPYLLQKYGDPSMRALFMFQGDPQTEEPVPLLTAKQRVLAPQGFWDMWVCRGRVFQTEGAELVSREELSLRLRHAALQEEKELERIRREVQAFQNLAGAAEARREAIPEDIRLFVWQRDQGKCVRCGSQELLEFDHIIPVAKGGSSTARNVQLLCEPCNRRKGAKI